MTWTMMSRMNRTIANSKNQSKMILTSLCESRKRMKKTLSTLVKKRRMTSTMMKMTNIMIVKKICQMSLNKLKSSQR